MKSRKIAVNFSNVAWTKAVLLDKAPRTTPVVYLTKHNGRDYRIAPDFYEPEMWRLDVLDLVIWEAVTSIKFESPAAAGAWFAERNAQAAAQQ